MVRAATLCIGDWVFHTPSGKPVKIDRETLFVAGKFVIGYDFQPIMLTDEFFIKNGFTRVDGDGKVYYYSEKDKDGSVSPAFVGWHRYPATDEGPEDYAITVHGNGCTMDFGRNIAVHELQAAMRICKIHKVVEV